MSLEFVLLSTLLLFLLATGGRRLALVKLCDDGLRNVLQLLLLRVVVLRVGLRVVLKPLDCSINCSLHLFLLFIGELASKLLLIIIGEELSILDHTLNILRLQPVLVIGNGDLLA